MRKLFFTIWQCLLLCNSAAAVNLMDAVGSDNVKAIADSLARADGKADLNKIGRGGQTPLMHAVLSGKLNAVRLLLDAGADVTIGEENGYTPMHGAGFQGRAEIADLLIAHGLSVHDQHEDGYTPFHRACWGIDIRHTDTVETFLNNGVEGTLLSKDGKSCLDMTTNKHTKKLIRNWIAQHDSTASGDPKKNKKVKSKGKKKVNPNKKRDL